MKAYKNLFQELKKIQEILKNNNRNNGKKIDQSFLNKVNKKIDGLSEDQKSYFENDKEDYLKSLETLQKSFLENNFSYFN